MNELGPAKHGLLAGADAPPHRADWTVDQGWESYTPAEHAVWRTLFDRQAALLPGRACTEYLAGMQGLAIAADAIPDFRRLSDILMRHTRWQAVAVPGLVPPEVFFEHLANRRFPAGQFIRRADQLDYIEEPDVFHDVFGHLPMLMHPVLADFLQAYGKGGLRAQRIAALDQLSRVYWFTIEFGLVAQQGGLRIYGSGIASSFAETRFALDDPSPNRIGFDLGRVMRTRYRIDDFQETYFVLDSLDDLLHLAEIDFAPIYQRAKTLPEVEPGELLPGDRIITAGSGAYHAAKRSAA
jgi:phenylalanine-4-hydroxylase